MKMKICFLDISRILFVLYLVYDQVIKLSVFHVPMLSQALVLSAVLFAILNERKIRINRSVLWYFAFTTYLMVAGTFVAIDRQLVNTYVGVFFEYVLIMTLIFIYVEKDKSMNFPIRAYIIMAAVMALVSIFWGRGIAGDTRASIAEGVNSNGIGVTLMFGIGLLLYELIDLKKKIVSVSWRIALLLLMLFVIMQTVSKKAIIGAAILILGWIWFCYNKSFKKISVGKKMILSVCLVSVGIFGFYWFVSNYSEKVEFIISRMDEITTGDSTQIRYQLIREGFEVFAEVPLLGVGLNNFRYYTSYNTYTHCSYVELLSCTGLVGTVLFIAPILKSAHKLFAYMKECRGKTQNAILPTQCTYMMLVLFVLLFVMFTQIVLYEFSLMYILSFCLSFMNVMAKDPTQKRLLIRENSKEYL